MENMLLRFATGSYDFRLIQNNEGVRVVRITNENAPKFYLEIPEKDMSDFTEQLLRFRKEAASFPQS